MMNIKATIAAQQEDVTVTVENMPGNTGKVILRVLRFNDKEWVGDCAIVEGDTLKQAIERAQYIK